LPPHDVPNWTDQIEFSDRATVSVRNLNRENLVSRASERASRPPEWIGVRMFQEKSRDRRMGLDDKVRTGDRARSLSHEKRPHRRGNVGRSSNVPLTGRRELGL
jgi:hypothetical protein